MTSLTLCLIGGILPTSKTIRWRRYPFVAEVQAVVRSDLPVEPPAFRLRDWMLSPAGQSIVEESGSVPALDKADPDLNQLQSPTLRSR